MVLLLLLLNIFQISFIYIFEIKKKKRRIYICKARNVCALVTRPTVIARLNWSSVRLVDSSIFFFASNSSCHTFENGRSFLFLYYIVFFVVILFKQKRAIFVI